MSGKGGAVGKVVVEVVEKGFKKADDFGAKAARRADGHMPHTPGRTPDAPTTTKKPIPPEVLARWNRGTQFNKDNYPRYAKNEVTLENGKRLDSYNPGESIVSRKHTQLAEVDEKTARSYINEIDNKYAPGTVIKDTPHNAPYGGTQLDGDRVLEIPTQNGPVPPSILQHAREKGVRIVDPTGHVYT